MNHPAELREGALDLRVTVGTITPKKRREGQERGRKTQSETANNLRVQWWSEAIRIFIDTYDRGLFARRNDLIDGLRRYNLAHNAKGKNGGQVKRSTITRWLTSDGEMAICREAIAKLIARSISSQLRPNR